MAERHTTALTARKRQRGVIAQVGDLQVVEQAVEAALRTIAFRPKAGLTEQVAALRRPGSKVVVVAHSMGALIALGAAAHREALPDRFVLSAPALDAAVAGWKRALAPFLSSIAPMLRIPTGIGPDLDPGDSMPSEELAPPPWVLAVTETGKDGLNTTIPKKGTSVPPAFLSVLSATVPATPARIELPADGRTTGRRSALARWLTDPANPFTARSAALTDAESRNVCATSGASTTMLLPAYRAAYLPRTPLLKS